MPAQIPYAQDPAFVSTYSRAWTEDPERLCDYFAQDGAYTDVPMGAT